MYEFRLWFVCMLHLLILCVAMTDYISVAASLSLYRFVLGVAVFYLALEVNEKY